MTSRPLRFPVGLTLGTVVVVAICSVLGVWQLGRAAWKARELARIAAMKTAPPQPIEPVLAKWMSGADVSFTRVFADCTPRSAPAGYKLVPDNGDWVARAQAICLLSGPSEVVLLDRGVLASSRGSTSAPDTVLPPPAHVVGVLYDTRPGPRPFLGTSSQVVAVQQREGRERPEPVLVVEHETPAPPGVTPTPYPDAASNLEYVGTYAPTWFGLAVVALGFYAALLWRRYHPKP